MQEHKQQTHSQTLSHKEQMHKKRLTEQKARKAESKQKGNDDK
jgi:hypothetical protein